MANSQIGLLFKWTILVFVIVVLLVGSWLLVRQRQFLMMVETLKLDGYPVSIADLQHEVEPGKTDALPLILKAKPMLNDFFEGLNQIHREYEDEDQFESGYLIPEYSVGKTEAVDELLQQHSELISLVDQAIRADDITVSNSPVINGSTKGDEDDLTFVVMDIMSMARLQLLRGRILIHQQRYNDAVDLGNATMSFATMLSQRTESGFSGTQFGFVLFSGAQIAYEAISLGQVDELRHQQIAETIGQFDPFEAARLAAIGERAFMIDHLLDFGFQHVAINGVPVLKHCDKQLQRIKSEVYEDGYEMEEYSMLKHGPFLHAIRDAAEYYRSNQVANIARLRGLSIINALIRNDVSANDFDASDDQQQLLISIGIEKQNTIDTCTGNLMQIDFVDGRWRAYSVGLDKVDNGGDLSNDAGLSWYTAAQLKAKKEQPDQ